MNSDAHIERIQAEIARAILRRFAMPSVVAFPEVETPRPAEEPLLLPPANPAHSGEPLYVEQDIDGYTIAEAQAVLDDFKRRRQRKTES